MGCMNIRPPMPEWEKCSSIKNSLKKVFFNPETGEVLDEKKNYIGQGRIEDGILKIQPAIKPSNEEVVQAMERQVKRVRRKGEL